MAKKSSQRGAVLIMVLMVLAAWFYRLDKQAHADIVAAIDARP